MDTVRSVGSCDDGVGSNQIESNRSNSFNHYLRSVSEQEPLILNISEIKWWRVYGFAISMSLLLPDLALSFASLIMILTLAPNPPDRNAWTVTIACLLIYSCTIGIEVLVINFWAICGRNERRRGILFAMIGFEVVLSMMSVWIGSALFICWREYLEISKDMVGLLLSLVLYCWTLGIGRIAYKIVLRR